MNSDPQPSATRVVAEIALASPVGVTAIVIRGKKATSIAIRAARQRTGLLPLQSYGFSEIGRDQLITALLDWRSVEDDMPDDEVRVMIACEGDTDEPEWGFHAGDKWWYDGKPHLSPVQAKVYAWAHIPALPPKKGAK